MDDQFQAMAQGDVPWTMPPRSSLDAGRAQGWTQLQRGALSRPPPSSEGHLQEPVDRGCEAQRRTALGPPRPNPPSAHSFPSSFSNKRSAGSSRLPGKQPAKQTQGDEKAVIETLSINQMRKKTPHHRTREFIPTSQSRLTLPLQHLQGDGKGLRLLGGQLPTLCPPRTPSS